MGRLASKYFLFTLLFAYCVFELSNPYIARLFQVVPKISNYMIAIIICNVIFPKPLKHLNIDVSLYYWTCSLLLIATINLPFVEYDFESTLKELLVSWFNILLLIPIIIRALTFKDFRYVYVIVYNLSLILLSIFWLTFIIFGVKKIGFIPLTRSIISPVVIYGWPLIFIYFFVEKKPLIKLYFLIGIISCIFLALTLAQRTLWAIFPIQSFIILLFILPKKNIFKASIFSLIISVFAIIIYDARSFNTSYTEYDEYFESRFDDTKNVLEDGTLYVRLAMAFKTYEVLKRYPFFGIGYSNNSFSSYNSGFLMVGDREVIAGQIDAHNTYLNILGTTGILGFICAFLYFLKLGMMSKKIFNFAKNNIEIASFFISMLGVFLWMFFATLDWSYVAYYFCPVFSFYLCYNNFYKKMTPKSY